MKVLASLSILLASFSTLLAISAYSGVQDDTTSDEYSLSDPGDGQAYSSGSDVDPRQDTDSRGSSEEEDNDAHDKVPAIYSTAPRGEVSQQNDDSDPAARRVGSILTWPIRRGTAAAKSLVRTITPSVPTSRMLLVIVLVTEIAALAASIALYAGSVEPAATGSALTGMVGPLPIAELVAGNPSASFFCGSCFDPTTLMHEITQHCGQIYQNFAGHQCPLPELLDYLPCFRGSILFNDAGPENAWIKHILYHLSRVGGDASDASL